MITVDDAIRIVLDRVSPLGSETVDLESASGRILAEDIHSDIDLPPYDRARMDGYALRTEDAAETPARLRLIGEIAAGSQFEGRVESGQAVKIFTGAPVPAGADAVQKVEVTESDGLTVLIKEPVKRGQFITPRAIEMSAGSLVARSGGVIGPPEMAVLASFGYARVRVGRRPRVAVISTGSELVEVTARPEGAQIRNSNSYSISSYAHRSGAIVDRLGTVRDTLDETREALLEAASRRDVVITSGGVSMGDYDLVKAALKEIGAEVYFDKVMIRPGKPIVFGRMGGTYFFGLPGNPVSTSVTFNVFARPALRILQGESSPLLTTVRARLSQAIIDSSSRRSYLPARLRIEIGEAVAEPLKWAGSSDLVAFMRANALIIVPEDVREIGAGETVDLLSLNEV
jgi:molybdenum cofactor synthesis domain-containing protein